MTNKPWGIDGEAKFISSVNLSERVGPRKSGEGYQNKGKVKNALLGAAEEGKDPSRAHLGLVTIQYVDRGGTKHQTHGIVKSVGTNTATIEERVLGSWQTKTGRTDTVPLGRVTYIESSLMEEGTYDDRG